MKQNTDRLIFQAHVKIALVLTIMLDMISRENPANIARLKVCAHGAKICTVPRDSINHDISLSAEVNLANFF